MSKMILDSKIDDGTGGNRKFQIFQTARQALHVPSALSRSLVESYVDERLGIVGADYLTVGNGSALHLIRCRPTGGHDHILRPSPSGSVDDHVLLEHLAVGERNVARLEDMYPAKADAIQKQSAELSEIWPVGETARRDGHKLTAVFEQTGRQRDEAGVEVGDFDPHPGQPTPLRRRRMDLAVRGVHDHQIELRRADRAKTRQAVRAPLDEVPGDNGAAHLGQTAKVRHSLSQWFLKPRVGLHRGDGQGAAAVAVPAIGRRGGQRPDARSRIEKSGGTVGHLEQASHEGG